MSLFELTGKSVLVTGASSGIGRAIAIMCSQQGATVVITGRDKARLEETLHLMSGERHTSFAGDLTKESDLDGLVEFVPTLDGWVSSAGISQPLLLQFAERDDVEQTINTNALSVIHLARKLLQQKKLRKGASVVFISSINGNRCAYIGSTIYAASKAMLTGFVKALALETAAKGIRVNCVEPGMIDTDLLNNSVISEEQLAEDRRKYPLKRYGKPEEVASAVVYLLSDATQWMTGSSLVMDGGYTLQ